MVKCGYLEVYTKGNVSPYEVLNMTIRLNLVMAVSQ